MSMTCSLCWQEIAIDYNRHSHARYRVCDSADSLQFGSFIPSRWEIPLEEIGQLFGAAAAHNEDFQCQQDSQLEVNSAPADLYSRYLLHTAVHTHSQDLDMIYEGISCVYSSPKLACGYVSDKSHPV